MRENLLTMPISEIFENSDGCPFCYMNDMLENNYLEYILGAAMMEPDVRIATNQQGFCYNHYEMMLKRKNRLSLALIMQTHLEHLKNNIITEPKTFENKAKKFEKLKQINNDCFVCSKIEWATSRFITTFFEMYSKSPEFVDLFKNQKFICLKHYEMLLEKEKANLSKDKQKSFESDCYQLVSAYLNELYNDVSHFCKMYDYRNSGKNADWGNSRNALEKSVDFLKNK